MSCDHRAEISASVDIFNCANAIDVGPLDLERDISRPPNPCVAAEVADEG